MFTTNLIYVCKVYSGPGGECGQSFMTSKWLYVWALKASTIRTMTGDLVSLFCLGQIDHNLSGFEMWSLKYWVNNLISFLKIKQSILRRWTSGMIVDENVTLLLSNADYSQTGNKWKPNEQWWLVFLSAICFSSIPKQNILSRFNSFRVKSLLQDNWPLETLLDVYAVNWILKYNWDSVQYEQK